MLDTEPRALCMLDKPSTPEPHSQPVPLLLTRTAVTGLAGNRAGWPWAGELSGELCLSFDVLHGPGPSSPLPGTSAMITITSLAGEW